MKIIWLTIKCKADPDHRKLLKFRLDPDTTMESAMHNVEITAQIITGTSPLYIHKPGPKSPIGKCATCGGGLEYTIEEAIDAERKAINAESEK